MGKRVLSQIQALFTITNLVGEITENIPFLQVRRERLLTSNGPLVEQALTKRIWGFLLRRNCTSLIN